MEPQYFLVLALVLGGVIGIIQSLERAPAILVFALVGGVWWYGGQFYEPDPEKSWLALQVGQLVVGFSAILEHIFTFVDEVAS